MFHGLRCRSTGQGGRHVATRSRKRPFDSSERRAAFGALGAIVGKRKPPGPIAEVGRPAFPGPMPGKMLGKPCPVYKAMQLAGLEWPGLLGKVFDGAGRGGGLGGRCHRARCRMAERVKKRGRA